MSKWCPPRAKPTEKPMESIRRGGDSTRTAARTIEWASTRKLLGRNGFASPTAHVVASQKGPEQPFRTPQTPERFRLAASDKRLHG